MDTYCFNGHQGYFRPNLIGHFEEKLTKSIKIQKMVHILYIKTPLTYHYVSINLLFCTCKNGKFTNIQLYILKNINKIQKIQKKYKKYCKYKAYSIACTFLLTDNFLLWWSQKLQKSQISIVL